MTPLASRPLTRISSVFGLYCKRVCVAMTCSTSLVPMPKAKAPKAPWVAVAVAADDRHARLGQPEFRPITWTTPVADRARTGGRRTPAAPQGVDRCLEIVSTIGRLRSVVGML